MSKMLPPVLLEIATQIQKEGGQATLVGGWVRDNILGIESKDYDVEIFGLEEDALLTILAAYGKVNLVGKAFGVYHIRTQKIPFDFSFPRTETKVGSGHKGFDVKPNPWLPFEEASLRRDFTINAMGMKIPQMELTDPQDGQIDLEQRLLRHVSDAFGEDPLRAVRAVQMASRFHLDIAPETILICQQQNLSELSTERFEEEFRKWLLKSPKPGTGLQWFQKLDILRFFPELAPQNEAWAALEKALDSISLLTQTLKDEKHQLILLYSILCSRMTNVKVFLERFTRDVKIIKNVLQNVETLHQVLSTSPNRIENPFAWIRLQSLQINIQDLCLLIEAYQQSNLYSTWVKEEALKANVLSSAPAPWIQGRDLIKLGQKPSPKFGELLQQVFHKQVIGELSSAEEALLWTKEQI